MTSRPAPRPTSADEREADPRIAPDGGRRSIPRTLARILLGLVLVMAGTGHLTVARQSFQAQVPTWLPMDPDFVVLASGVVEIVLGLSLVLLGRWRVWVGLVVAAFFVAIFPGNISQLVTRTPAFGLETDAARAIRLVFQPLLVIWALGARGAWSAGRTRRARR
ncbi:DoxX family protein [Clavibacter michiganensis]|uniref:DoxX family protein n=1 Tax=Clavibacter michiganensis TaxID=28447 RepID=UPI00292F3E4E|nr:DoxX family membrane protein [Clavibacter michiganensis]